MKPSDSYIARLDREWHATKFIKGRSRTYAQLVRHEQVQAELEDIEMGIWCGPRVDIKDVTN